MHQKKLFLTHYNHHALALIHALTNALIHALTHALIHALTHAKELQSRTRSNNNQKLELQSRTRSNNNQKITLNKEDETLVDILETYDSVNSEKTSLPYTLNLIFYIILFCY